MHATTEETDAEDVVFALDDCRLGGLRPVKCQWGDTVSITQTGDKVQLNNGSGSFADGKITSNITVSGAPPFSANGVILPDRSIQWSNGTHWMKQ